MAEFMTVFMPMAHVVRGDVARLIEPFGPSEWPTSDFSLTRARALAAQYSPPQPAEMEIIADRRTFLLDPKAPEWVRNWAGPYKIILRRVVPVVHRPGKALMDIKGAAPEPGESVNVRVRCACGDLAHFWTARVPAEDWAPSESISALSSEPWRDAVHR